MIENFFVMNANAAIAIFYFIKNNFLTIIAIIAALDMLRSELQAVNDRYADDERKII